MTSYTWKRILTCAALCCALTGCGGCDDENNPYLTDSDFPGRDLTENNVGSDGRSFSNPDESIDDEPRIFWNVKNRTAIVTYMTESESGGQIFLNASFFDGTEFTPPVSIRGATDDGYEDFGDPQVLFLDAPNRTGDAIIIFTREDAEDEFTPQRADRDANIRLYGTYFDYSLRNEDQEGTVRHGFEPTATEIDFDNITQDPADDPDVIGYGFVSDSLRGTHVFDGSGAPALSGEPTTQVHIAFAKAQSSGATTVGARWHTVAFDLTQVGNAIPAQQANGAGTLLSAGGAFDEEFDSVDGTFVVHNEHALWRVQNLGMSNTQDVVTDSIHSPGGVTNVLLGSALTADNSSTNLPDREDVYGADHGLDALYAFFSESGFSSGMNGSRMGDGDLMVAQIANGGTSRELAEIDAYTSVYNDGDADNDLVYVNTTGAGIGSYQTRLNAEGTFVTVVFTQPSRTANDLDDGNMSVGAGPVNYVPYVQVVQTARDGVARSLGSSVLGAPIKVPAIESTGDYTTGNDVEQLSTDAIDFQIELVTGAGAGTGAYQSNANRVFFSYEQAADQAGMGQIPSQKLLYVNGLDVTLGSSPSAALTATTTTAARVALPGAAAGLDINWMISYDAVVVDRADAPNGYLAFFKCNANNASDTTVMDSFYEPRLYAYDGTTTSLVSTSAGIPTRLVSDEPWVRTVGTGTGRRIHALWLESVDLVSSASELVARSYEKNGGTFAPAIDTSPVVLDLPTANTVSAVTIGADGDTLGVYFTESGHIYYEETTGDATRFHESDGERDATIVDNDDFGSIFMGLALVYLAPFTDDLRDSMAMWAKPDIGSESIRLFVRVHD